MSENRSIKLFYFTNLFSSALGGIGGLLLLALLSQAQYGLYTLFATFVLQFMILSFGYPDGILIDYRKDDGNINLRSVSKDLRYITKLQIGILILTLIGFNLLNICLFHFETNLTIIINIALCAVMPQALIDNFRGIYISLKDFNNIAKIDAFNKSYLILLVIPIIFFFKSPYLIYIFMAFDVTLRLLFLLYLFYNFHKKYKTQIQASVDEHLAPSRHFKKGLFLLIGNWLVILIYSLDKMFLSNDNQTLGLYTQALFFFGIIYQLIMPFKDVIFVKINEKMSNHDIFVFSMYMMVIIFLLISIFSYVVVPGGLYLCNFIANMHIQMFGINDIATKFLEYKDALSLSQLLVVMIPTYITVQLVLDNLLMIKMQSHYAFKTLVNFIIAFLIYVVCVNTAPTMLLGVVSGTIIMSIFLFFNNLFSVTNFRCAIKGLLLMGVIVGIYFVGLFHGLVALLLVIGLFIGFLHLKKLVNQLSFNRNSDKEEAVS